MHKMDDFPIESELVIRAGSRVLVTIKANGQLIYGPDYTPDQAAAGFWMAVARQTYVQEKEVLYRHMEKTLIDVGKADLENERAQLRAQALGGMGSQGGSSVLEAHRANSVLEQMVHKAIELGRGLAERRDESEPSGSPLN
jgi:hypothetical protein